MSFAFKAMLIKTPNKLIEAAAVHNLGNVYESRGENDRAEEMFVKSLKISEEIGDRQEIARGLVNFGILAEYRGDLVKAQEWWTKSRDLYSEIGILHKAKEIQDYLDKYVE